MEAILIWLINSAAAILDGFSDILSRHPWAIYVFAFSPALPALLGRAFASAVLIAVLGFAGSLTTAFDANLGLSIWVSAWLLSLLAARSKSRKRAKRRLEATQNSI